MDDFALIAVLITGVVLLTPLSERIGVPQPVTLTIFGLFLAALPFAPDLALEPDLILPVGCRRCCSRRPSGPRCRSSATTRAPY